MTLAIYGVGMVVGVLLAGRAIRALPFGLVIVIGPIEGLAAALVMARHDLGAHPAPGRVQLRPRVRVIANR